jgi:putative transposase
LFAASFEDATTKSPAPKGQLTCKPIAAAPCEPGHRTAARQSRRHQIPQPAAPSNGISVLGKPVQTMKYQPQFPHRFGCIEDAKAFCRGLFE